MAGLLSFPNQAGTGLLARRYKSDDPLLKRFLDAALTAPVQAPMMADAADEAMFARNPNGAGGPIAPMMAPTPAATQPALNGAIAQPQAPAQRNRVSGWRLLDRVLGGETITGGLDAERTRLQAEAERPQQQARIQAALGAITDPRERALFLGLGGEDWQKNVAQQYAPQVIAPGAIQAIGGRAAVGAPQQYDQGDQRRSFDPVTRQDILVNERGPTIAERTAQDRLAWDQQYGGGQLDVARQNADTSRMNAETTADNSGFTLGGGQSRFNADGSPIASVAPTNAAATSPAAIELQGRVDSTRRDVLPTTQRMRGLLTSGDVITGFGADARLAAARALAATGNEEAQRKVAATQEYQNLSGALRVGIAKSLGANPSNADILLLEKITAGDVGQSPDALLATIGQAESRANSLITDVEAQIAATRSQSGGQSSNPIATNPTTGERVQWDGSAWVPI